MKIAKLLHNTNAGDKAHDKEQLIEQIKAHGYKCHYASTKKSGWKSIENDVDFIILAGGDGTVRKVAKMLLCRSRVEKNYPIALLPKGTANNLAKSLNLPENDDAIMDAWKYENLRKFDVGVIYNLDEPHFFLESFGFGLFPNLMNEMKLMGKENMPKDPKEKLIVALETLKKLIASYSARKCDIVLDGVKHTGKYLMVEVMNTPSIGPNLLINPIADTSDEYFEIILINEEEREHFIQYIQDKIDGKDTAFFAKSLRGKNLSISWDGVHGHIDDELIKTERCYPIEIRLHENLLKFVVPREDTSLEATA